MAKQCDDFTYLDKTMKFFDFVSVDFEDNSDIPMALSREITKGETNSYKKVANHYGVKNSDVLVFQIHICKDPDTYHNQTEMIFSEDNIRNVVRWLMSSSTPKWLSTEYKSKVTNYRGLFTNVETFVVGGEVMGLKLEFTCDSQYSYTDEIIMEKHVSGYSNTQITNNSDELESYAYPTITVNSSVTGQVFLYNETDSNILKTATLPLTSSENDSKTAALLNAVIEYGAMHGYNTEFRYIDEPKTPTMIINNTGVEFKYTNKFGTIMHCTAYYDSNDKYTIFEGGFMRLKALANNPIKINCGKYQIYDSLNREILLSDIGLEDVGEMYWMRFLSGNNTIRMFAENALITFVHREERKVGAV